MAEQANIEQAERRLQQLERRLLNDALKVGHADAPALVRNALDLAGHAAMPVVCDADFLHLLRINFFVDSDALPYWVEGRMLLSPLWQDLGNGLYTMEPVLRRLLLQRLIANHGARRTREVATLLWQASERATGWAEKTELRHAQQLTALNFLAPSRASEWLAQAEKAGGGETLDDAWLVAMGGELKLPQAREKSGDARLMCDLLLSLAPAEDNLDERRSPFSVIHGDPGVPLQWQLLQHLARRSSPPRLLWLEVDLATRGKRLFARLPGRRDRTEWWPGDTSRIDFEGNQYTVVAIDHAEGMYGKALEAWVYYRFREVEVCLLFHRRLVSSKEPESGYYWIQGLAAPAAREPWPRFSRDTLVRWFNGIAGRTPPGLQADSPGTLLLYVDTVLKATNGVPERVFERLCADAGVRWSEVQAIARARLEPPASVSAEQALLALAREYDATREKPASPARTQTMEGIVRRVQPLLADISESLAQSWTGDASAGVRLLAVRWLYDRPDPHRCLWLAQCVMKERPFIGYHALLALQQAAHRLPMGDLDVVEAAIEHMAPALARLRSDTDRQIAYDDVWRILGVRRGRRLLVPVGELPLVPGTEFVWVDDGDLMREANEQESVFCGDTQVGGVGTVAGVLDRLPVGLRLFGRERVRVIGLGFHTSADLVSYPDSQASAPLQGADTADKRSILQKTTTPKRLRAEVEHYPDDPPPPTPELKWGLVRSALNARRKLDPSPDAKSLVLARDDLPELYQNLLGRIPFQALQAVYAIQDRTDKLERAFWALTYDIERLLPNFDSHLAQRVLPIIAGLFTEDEERRKVSVGMHEVDDETWKRFSWPPGDIDSRMLASALALRPEHEALWTALRTPSADGKSQDSPLHLWPNGSTLRLRFIGGDRFRRGRVLAVAQAWFEHANLKLQVLPIRSKAKVDLRVGFDEQAGSWSYLGTDARSVAENAPTMNLGWVGPGYDEAVARQSILKEFGHALGLIQEHQNPNRTIEWNEAAVVEELSGPPNSWDRATIKRNLLDKYRPFDYRPFDPRSVMMYTVPAHWVKTGQAMGGATDLSESDKALIARLYPRTAPRPSKPPPRSPRPRPLTRAPSATKK